MRLGRRSLPVRALLWVARALLLVCLVGVGPASVARAAEPTSYALVQPKGASATASVRRPAKAQRQRAEAASGAATAPGSCPGGTADRGSNAPQPAPRSPPRYLLFCSLLR